MVDRFSSCDVEKRKVTDFASSLALEAAGDEAGACRASVDSGLCDGLFFKIDWGTAVSKRYNKQKNSSRDGRESRFQYRYS